MVNTPVKIAVDQRWRVGETHSFNEEDNHTNRLSGIHPVMPSLSAQILIENFRGAERHHYVVEEDTTPKITFVFS